MFCNTCNPLTPHLSSPCSAKELVIPVSPSCGCCVSFSDSYPCFVSSVFQMPCHLFSWQVPSNYVVLTPLFLFYVYFLFFTLSIFKKPILFSFISSSNLLFKSFRLHASHLSHSLCSLVTYSLLCRGWPRQGLQREGVA